MNPTPEIDFLFQAILSLRNTDECHDFFDDLLTIRERYDMSQRFQIALQLFRGESYEKISQCTGASSATISRVSRCLTEGTGGYATVLHHLSISPTEKES